MSDIKISSWLTSSLSSKISSLFNPNIPSLSISPPHSSSFFGQSHLCQSNSFHDLGRELTSNNMQLLHQYLALPLPCCFHDAFVFFPFGWVLILSRVCYVDENLVLHFLLSGVKCTLFRRAATCGVQYIDDTSNTCVFMWMDYWRESRWLHAPMNHNTGEDDVRLILPKQGVFSDTFACVFVSKTFRILAKLRKNSEFWSGWHPKALKVVALYSPSLVISTEMTSLQMLAI